MRLLFAANYGHPVTDGPGYTLPLPGDFSIQLNGSGCEAAVDNEVVPDAGTWELNDAENEEFDWRTGVVSRGFGLRVR